MSRLYDRNHAFTSTTTCAYFFMWGFFLPPGNTTVGTACRLISAPAFHPIFAILTLLPCKYITSEMNAPDGRIWTQGSIRSTPITEGNAELDNI